MDKNVLSNSFGAILNLTRQDYTESSK